MEQKINRENNEQTNEQTNDNQNILLFAAVAGAVVVVFYPKQTCNFISGMVGLTCCSFCELDKFLNFNPPFRINSYYDQPYNKQIFEIGDHIIIKRNIITNRRYCYYHHGIVSEINNFGNILKIIHPRIDTNKINGLKNFYDKIMAYMNKNILCETGLKEFIDNDDNDNDNNIILFKAKYECENKLISCCYNLKQLSKNKIVERAKEILADNNFKYNIVTNNCEHFAVSCSTGYKYSSQINAIIKWFVNNELYLKNHNIDHLFNIIPDFRIAVKEYKNKHKKF